jgi:hypothetical protein
MPPTIGFNHGLRQIIVAQVESRSCCAQRRKPRLAIGAAVGCCTQGFPTRRRALRLGGSSCSGSEHQSSSLAPTVGGITAAGRRRLSTVKSPEAEKRLGANPFAACGGLLAKVSRVKLAVAWGWFVERILSVSRPPRAVEKPVKLNPASAAPSGSIVLPISLFVRPTDRTARWASCLAGRRRVVTNQRSGEAVPVQSAWEYETHETVDWSV